MKRAVHDIFDVLLKIMLTVYGTAFLNYIGIEEEMERVLNVEFTTLDGSKYYLDFLCLLKNGELCHVEFQYPYVKPDDMDRFYFYNALIHVRHKKVANTIVFNFMSRKVPIKAKEIGKTICFSPQQFCLEDVDFEMIFKNINIKVNSNRQLSHFEEITLMLMPLHPMFLGDANVLKRISEILLKKELFDVDKYQFIQAIVELEIENLLSSDGRKEVYGRIRMTPEAQSVVLQAIHEVNQKVLVETERKGIKEGMEKGMEKGRNAAMKDVAKNLRDKMDIEEVSEITGLTVEEIQNL